jgi:hypothetical protein
MDYMRPLRLYKREGSMWNVGKHRFPYIANFVTKDTLRAIEGRLHL